jgi:imidazoleglycerol-phosphate dehydratase
MARKARIRRRTKETDISVEVNLDGGGSADVETPIPFLSHMIENLGRHALFDIRMRAKGDIEVDLHHTVEDAGITLGEAIRKALGDKTGIVRAGSASFPMMDSLSTVSLDIGGRPNLRFNLPARGAGATRKILAADGETGGMKAAFDMGLAEEFMKALSNSAGMDLHVTLVYGSDPHHSIESMFKALGRALGAATARDKRIKGVQSTKGAL